MPAEATTETKVAEPAAKAARDAKIKDLRAKIAENQARIDQLRAEAKKAEAQAEEAGNKAAESKNTNPNEWSRQVQRSGAKRIGAGSRGLDPWQSTRLEAADHPLP